MLLQGTKRDCSKSKCERFIRKQKNFENKSYLGNKGLNSNKMLLKGKGTFINKFSISITKSLNLREDQSSPVVIWTTLFKNLFLTRVLIRLEKLMKKLKRFLSNK